MPLNTARPTRKGPRPAPAGLWLIQGSMMAVTAFHSGLTNFLTLLNSRPLKVNNSGFDLSPVDMLLSHDLKRGTLS